MVDETLADAAVGVRDIALDSVPLGSEHLGDGLGDDRRPVGPHFRHHVGA